VFEFIGMAVVAWVGFVIVRAILAGARNATLSKAVTYARLSGVPREFSQEALIFSEMVIQTRRQLSWGNPAFGALDAHEQYGKALIHLHDKAREIEARRVGDEVRAIFKRQADQLYNYGPCYISAMYISALALELSKTALTPQQLKEIFDYCFEHPTHDIPKKVAWDELSERDGIEHGLAGMRNLV